MAFNKSKALENALKYLNQGKVAQAIAEYQQILRNDAKDQATLMTVGDLFARQGDMPHAIEYFERLAQVYLSDGFNSKAIAIYKKIAKLAPNELAPLERLADLYVQQGVLSEARPLFLQIAEAYLKANKSQKALEVLHRLLDVEPDNLRVQMRLAELYNVMGQKKEAAQTYLSYAQRLFDRGEMDEAVKLIERALEVDSSNAGATLLKAKALAHGGKNAQAVAILESHPEANAGGDVTNMLLDLELKAGQLQKAADRGRKILARGHAHFAPLYKVVEAEIEGGQTAEALALLHELRDPMIEAGEQDKFMKALGAITQKDPKQIAPLEELVDFCRHTSNSHQLPLAIVQLSDACANAGNFARAEELLQDLIEHNKDDERLVERLNQLRARSGGAPLAPATVVEKFETILADRAEEHAVEETPPAAPAIIEEPLDEETQKYIAQRAPSRYVPGRRERPAHRRIGVATRADSSRAQRYSERGPLRRAPPAVPESSGAGRRRFAARACAGKARGSSRATATCGSVPRSCACRASCIRGCARPCSYCRSSCGGCSARI